MARRAKTKTSRRAGASPLPTPVSSALPTPLSSAYPSTYASEAEWDPEDDATLITVRKLSIVGAPASSEHSVTKAKASAPFPFMSLPSELRCKIYGFHFAETNLTIDLDPQNYKLIHKKLAIFRVCRTIYAEASHYFYSTRTFRIFPTHPGRFFKTKRPLLARLNARQRSCLTSLELRLGPGWSMPPRGWVVNSALGLRDCVNVRHLTVFVQCDPSDGVFKGFRRSEGFYEAFSHNLFEQVLAELTSLDRVYFDAWTSVKKSGPLMKALFEVARARGRKICFGPERGWTDQEDEDELVPLMHPPVQIGYPTAGVLVVA